MCIKVNKDVKKLTYNRKNIYVLVIKRIHNMKIKSLTSSYEWNQEKIHIDNKFKKHCINNKLIDYYAPHIGCGMFHVSPFLISMFKKLKEDMPHWCTNGKKRIYLAKIPAHSYIVHGVNYRCSTILNDLPAICTNKLQLIKPITSQSNFYKLKKKYKINI